MGLSGTRLAASRLPCCSSNPPINVATTYEDLRSTCLFYMPILADFTEFFA